MGEQLFLPVLFVFDPFPTSICSSRDFPFLGVHQLTWTNRGASNCFKDQSNATKMGGLV
ncbi:hypothetical protein COLO4_04527 [Corchorus olitorius]|uniref:Uncharacterized protein n=1 Tax=Corchorus olitorius TaxID=93759 RepID=A0A1R3KTR1_9ROSI|nr:hypothetical protein COLO4_04527 [Corchorus olitorius]